MKEKLHVDWVGGKEQKQVTSMSRNVGRMFSVGKSVQE